MKPLLIVGLPKGFSSQTWQISMRATGLACPDVSDGEVLNHQRIEETGGGWIRQFLRENRKINDGFYSVNQSWFGLNREILNHFSESAYCIKDVVQPFFVLKYLAENPAKYNVLFCDRPLEEVEERQRYAGWKYAKDMKNVRESFLAFPSFRVHHALYDCNAIFNCLQNLGYKVNRFNYLTEDFIRRRNALYKCGIYRPTQGNSFNRPSPNEECES